MKIIYINCSRIPTEKAHGLQMMKMCDVFANSNLKSQTPNLAVELWVPRRFNHIKQGPFEYYGIHRNFTIRKVPCIDFIPADKFLGPLAFWLTESSFLLFVICYLLFSRPSVIYTRDKFVVSFLSFFWNNIFFETHEISASIFFSRFKKIRGVIAITQNLKNELVRRGVSAAKIMVAPDGVDLDEFDIPETQKECRKKLGLPQGKKIVLYTGHLYPWKGAQTLLEAAKFLIFNFQLPNTLFVFVGGKEEDIKRYKLQVPSYLKDLPKGDELQNVKIVGHRPHREIPYWLRAADILILPNSAKYDISKYWTSPMKLFEYMAAGKPIVASDLPSIREVLNENNAIFVEPDNASALILAINDLLCAGSKGDAIAARARENVKEYTWSKRAKKILEFIVQRYVR